MLDYAGGIFIAAATIAIFALGMRFAHAGDGQARIEAVISGIAFMALSGAFALWVVLLR